MRKLTSKRALASIVLSVLLLPRASAQCPDWTPGFGGTGTDSAVFTMKVLDDGTGPAVFAGGDFLTAGGAWAPYVAKWNGTEWSAFGDWLGGAVFALGEFDDGTGPAIYVAGSFPEGIRKWNGTSYENLGPSNPLGLVLDMTVFDDGTGPALYAAGQFQQIGSTVVNYVAKWDGVAWSALGSGLSSGPNSAQATVLEVFDDGTGPALYVGGHFATAGGVTANNVAKWDGSTWSALGDGVSAGVTDATVDALVTMPPASGGRPKLCAAGEFTSAGGVAANRVATWNGGTWSAVGAGFDGYVSSLSSFDDGNGRALYAGGGFLHSGAADCKGIARWTGTGWTPLATGVEFGYIASLAGVETGARTLYAGGDFSSIGGVAADHVAAWNGSSWSPLTHGEGMDELVTALVNFDDGGGRALYAGGSFREAGNTSASSIARWDGSQWSDVGGGTDGTISAFSIFDDGGGPALYAGGTFGHAGGSLIQSIARWDGASWSGLDSGALSWVSSLAVYDDGSGPALYAGGILSSAGGVPVHNVARWDGTSWSALGVGGSEGTIGIVRALAVFDDGTGPALYVAGDLTAAGGSPVNRIARWDGGSWSALGTGTDGTVNALAVFDDVTGPALYAGGSFRSAGGANARCVARWSGSAWSSVGPGLTGFGTTAVVAFTVYDDGSGGGVGLYAGGEFTFAGGAAVSSIARWDGSTWTALDLGLQRQFSGSGPTVRALGVHDDGTGRKPSLFAGGSFVASNPFAAYRIAEWRGCDAVGLLECFGDGSGTACPCGNSSAHGARSGCANSLQLAGMLRDSGGASLAHDSLTLLGSGMPNSTEVYLQGTASVNGGAGAVLGDGLGCVGGSTVRLCVRAATNGSSSYPGPNEPPVSAAGGVGVAGTRIYQILYRDAAAFCAPSTFNTTNGLRISWTP